MSRPNYRELLPDLVAWEKHNNCKFEPSQWIGCVGSYEHAIGYLHIFWPQLLEYDGCIFVGNAPDEQNYKSWLDQTGGNKRAVEAVLNHIHIEDLFQVGHLEPTQAQIEFIGEKLRDMWKAKARMEFPELDIAVKFYRGNGENLREYEVTMFQPQEES